MWPASRKRKSQPYWSGASPDWVDIAMVDTNINFQQAFKLFDAANAEDPRTEVHEGKPYPQELLYAQRMTTWLEKFEPNASEALQLAVRAQHICRWKIPRNQYPMDRDGYKRWRTALGKMHGDIASNIMRQAGCQEELCLRVKSLLMKEMQTLAEQDGQTLEDVICLVFLEFYFVPFAAQYSPQKLTSIVRKTWKKMSARGQKTALTLAPQWPESLLEIVQRAIAE